ncbi:hypothetical protein BDD12DRAFT_819389 [Trichophaea hybrida]|nr:hypothetical protein BDD12DRAFT_819389 [Trichophaea hybrida]
MSYPLGWRILCGTLYLCLAHRVDWQLGNGQEEKSGMMSPRPIVYVPYSYYSNLLPQIRGDHSRLEVIGGERT